MVSFGYRTSRRKRLELTLKSRFHHPDLRREISKFKCELCQKHKLPGKCYVLLPERQINCQPFIDAAVDLIDPWTVKVGHRNATFSALTILDLVTNLTELVRIENKEANHVARVFAQTWLSRYP